VTDGPERYGNYDPFEDTGDWPFRDAPPPEESSEREDPFAADAAPQLITAPVEAEEPVAERLVPEPEPEPEQPDPESEPALASAAPLSDPEPEPEPELELEPDFEPEPRPAEPEAVEPEPVEPEAVEQGEEDEPQQMGDVAVVADELVDEEIAEEDELEPMALPAVADHAAGELSIPDGVDVLTGAPHGFRRSVGVVVSRFNGEITTGMLEHALQALRECHVADDAITVVPVPGAFELPLTALALAKTRRFACVVALGCIIRGETPHFDVIAGEAASGLQLAAIETGIPVSFGVLTCDTREQAEARIGRAADAARTALEMADLFSHVRTRTAQS